jgi:hypothetical protein
MAEPRSGRSRHNRAPNAPHHDAINENAFERAIRLHTGGEFGVRSVFAATPAHDKAAKVKVLGGFVVVRCSIYVFQRRTDR